MKSLIIFFLFNYFLIAGVTTSYENNNDDARILIPKLFNGVNNISLSPTNNESQALYQLSHKKETLMSLCYSTTLEGIIKHNTSDKLSKYMLVTPILKGEVHLIISANSRFRTINDLEKHNVSMGVEGTANNLIGKSIFLDANIPISEFHYSFNEGMRRLLGGGIDAVVALGKSPLALLSNYKGKFKLLSIPSNGTHRNATIRNDVYGLAGNTMTISSDLLLIAKRKEIEQHSLNTLLSQVTRNLLHSNGVDIPSLCSNNGNYGLSVSSTLNASCTQYKNELANSGKGKVIVALDLLRQANSIEEVEIYNDALRKNKAIGGLSFDTESAKFKQVYDFFKKEKGSKLIIKSYVNSNEGDAYTNAKFIFKYLRKMGINRGDMIIKSFNNNNFCLDNKQHECNFLNRKIIFEFSE